MEERKNRVRAAGTQPDDFKLRKLEVNLGNAYMRLAARDRRKVMRLFGQIVFGKGSSGSYWDNWSKDDMKTCYLQLLPISQKFAKDMRRWASQISKTGDNNKLALKCLIEELIYRRWIEEP